MNDEPGEFYLGQNEPFRSCLLTLRDVILKQDDDITETRKYGMPCFCFRKKPICYLWVDRKLHTPYILMVDGRHLNHSALETGGRSRMKIFRVNPETDLPLRTIRMILAEAIALRQ